MAPCCLLVAWLIASAARLGVAAEEPFSVDVWGTRQGLPQSSVIAIAQSHDGYLWLGTLNGLVRFDGANFTVFDESTTPGLPSSRIVYLFADSHTNLWIGTEAAGVALVRNGQIRTLDIGVGAGEGRLASAAETPDGAVWLYTANGQLCRHREGTVDVWNVGAELPSRRRVLAQEHAGPLWIGMDWALFGAKEAKSPREQSLDFAYQMPVARLDTVLASRHGGYWRLANGQIEKWRTNRLEHSLGRYPWGAAPVAAACEDPQGNLIVGTSGAGVFWFQEGAEPACLSTNNGLSHNYVLSLHADAEGTLWVGTNGGGLNRVKRRRFEALAPTRGWVVQSVCGDAQGALWVASNGDAAGRWKSNQWSSFGAAEGLPSRYIRSVLVDTEQRVWAGTLGAGLFERRGDRFELAAAGGAVHPVVTALFQDRRGTLWLGTPGGLVRREGASWRLFSARDGLSTNAVRALADDAAGLLWVGTAGGGLNRFKDGQFTVYRKRDGLPSDQVSALLCDAEGVLWVGTDGGGLARYDGQRWTRYSTREGLASNSIGYLAEDADGFLWIGSNAGLMRIARKALNDFANQPASFLAFRTFSETDGLPTRECTQGSQPSAWRAPDGRMWFSTVAGAVSVHPRQLTANPKPPPVVIESVLIDGTPQDAGALGTAVPSAVTLSAGRRRLEIHYTALNLAAPDRARFRYRLADQESVWTDAGGTRMVLYPALPPGDYRFEVSACNEDGVWNERGASLAITVLPPFWRAWWFLTASGLVLLGAVAGTVHFVSTQRLQREVAQMKQKEALEHERSRIARDLHDQLGASLTQVALLGELAEADKELPDEIEGHARQISRTARDTTRVLDEIVWAVNPSNDTLEGLVNYICKYAQEYLAVAGLRYRLEVPPQLPSVVLPPEVRHNVFLAAKEAVTNIVRHAQASEAHIRLQVEPGRCVLEITDNGRGVADPESEAAQRRNGLRNMRRRLQDVGGDFTIGPAPGGGAQARFTFPLSRPGPKPASP